jgi:hypothetical protein
MVTSSIAGVGVDVLRLPPTGAALQPKNRSLCAAIAAAPARAAVSEDNFLVRNAGDLVALCNVGTASQLLTAFSSSAAALSP